MGNSGFEDNLKNNKDENSKKNGWSICFNAYADNVLYCK